MKDHWKLYTMNGENFFCKDEYFYEENPLHHCRAGIDLISDIECIVLLIKFNTFLTPNRSGLQNGVKSRKNLISRSGKRVSLTAFFQSFYKYVSIYKLDEQFPPIGDKIFG